MKRARKIAIAISILLSIILVIAATLITNYGNSLPCPPPQCSQVSNGTGVVKQLCVPLGPCHLGDASTIIGLTDIVAIILGLILGILTFMLKRLLKNRKGTLQTLTLCLLAFGVSGVILIIAARELINLGLILG